MKKILMLLANRLGRRKKWIVVGSIFFVMEMMVFIYPFGWLKEEITNYLTGADAWTLVATSENAGYCQMFVPEHKYLKSVSVVVTTDGQPLGDGDMRVVISDLGGIVFAEDISYADIAFDQFMDIDTNLVVDAGETYYLTINMGQDDKGFLPSLRVCSMEQPLPENEVLMQGETIEDVQLVTRYVYENAIDRDKLVSVVALCLLTAIGIMFGLPENRILRTITGYALLIALPYVLGRRLELLTINTGFMLPFALKGNMAIMYILELVLLLCTNSTRFTVALTGILLTIVYSVNYYVYAFRGVPVRVNEITAAQTATQVMGQYDLRPNTHLATAWCIAAFFIVFSFSTGKWERRKIGRTIKEIKSNESRFVVKRIVLHLVSFFVGIVVMVVVGYQLLYTDFLEKKGFVNFHGFDSNMNYHFNGFLVSTCIDIQNSRIEKPEGYSEEIIEEIFGKIEKQNDEETVDLPHVILIMNESFSDLRILGNLQLSEENLMFFNSLEENTVRGYVNASVLGGGTANSEFEVFTGCSMGLLPASYYAYQQCVTRPLNSIVSNMEKNGYTTYSMHPELKQNWNRAAVYDYFGFDYQYWIDDFDGAEKMHAGVKDSATYDKVIDIYENREESEKLFIFDLTMQNHGGYGEAGEEDTVYALNTTNVEAAKYLSLIKSSDQDFKELVSYFEQQDEKVIICMFGDHQPKFMDESFYETIYQQTDNLSSEDIIMNQYKTPFVIWANYDIEEQPDMDISLNYLGVLLMDVAGVKMSDFFLFLKQHMLEYPIITINGYVDAEEHIYEWTGNNNEFPEYRMLQYNYLFDKNSNVEGF